MLKRILAGAASAALAVLAATPGVASAQPAHSQSIHVVPASHVLNLHQAYERALPHVHLGGIAIEYARGKAPKAAAAKAPGLSCSEPNCPLPYGGGPVQHSPHIYLVLWGTGWSSDSNEAASAAYLESFYQGLGTAQDGWSRVAGEYGDSQGYPEFSGSVYMGAFQDTTTAAPSVPTDQQIAAEADAFATSQKITDLADAQIVVALQSGMCPVGFASSCNTQSNQQYCAWHSISNEPFTNLPYLPDAIDVGGGPGSGCGANVLDGPNDGFSVVGGHEYAETITDPNTQNGWWDPNDQFGGEIGDKCAWVYPGTNTSDIQNITLPTGQFAVQPLFSNLALGLYKNGCARLTAPAGNRVKSGKGQCLDNYKGRFTSGNKADVWKCTGANRQYWIPIRSHLYNNGHCLTDASGKLVLAACKTGKSSQIWRHKSNGEYVLKLNGRCLTEPATKNGTQVTVARCKNTARQHWTKA